MEEIRMSTGPATALSASSSISPGRNQSQPPDLNPRITPQQQSPSPPPPQHRRGYQACDPCRKRKVKCDLGSVDNPRPPPCVRCRRESKRCEFSATRRKRKISEDTDDKASALNVLRRDKRMMVADGTLPPLPASSMPPSVSQDMDMDTAINTDVNINTNPNPNANINTSTNTNGATSHPRPGIPSYEDDDTANFNSARRKWSDASDPHRISMPPTTQTFPVPSSTIADQHRTNRSSFSNNARPAMLPHMLDGGQHMMNKTAAELLSPAISNTHDALHLLSEAAGRTEDLNRQQLEYQYGAGQSSSSTFTSSASPNTGTPKKSSRSNSNANQNGPSKGWYHQGKAPLKVDPPVDRANTTTSPPKAPKDLDYAKARRAWSRFRFIRAGWFSIDEGMAYVTYYYDHLAPLSPIVLKNFSSPSTHLTLLTEEPFLTVTMLTIASRHMKLSGNGADSRAYSIHEKLWSYLKGMIERLFWGQEEFGGSGIGTGPTKPMQFDLSTPSSGQPKLHGNLRSLGTIEALLLLTDWHPRALHFPPGDDENTLLDMDPQLLSQVGGDTEEEHDPDHPAGKNQSGPGEGRVAFHKWLEPVWRSDRMSWMLLSTAQALSFELGIFDDINDPKKPIPPSPERVRKRRLRRLVLVYISQSSGRLGIPSMLPLPKWSQNTDPILAEDLQSPESQEEYAVDMMQDCWMDISKIMYTSNQILFLTKEQTTNLIKSGRYREQIDEFIPSLNEFKQKLDNLTVAPHMRHILTIEYEYTRLYINCLALQAVVERWTTMTNEATTSNQANGGNPAASGGGTAPLRVLLEQYEVNEPYIQEVVDASRKILHTVLEGLVPGDYLKHAPVRTFFRILSGMIFILKTFTLGAKEDDVRVSLELQDRIIECLRSCTVDDVHLSVTIADLLDLLTANIRTRFLRFAPFDRVGECGSRERTPLPPSRQQSPRPREQQAHDQSDYRWQHNHSNNTNSFQFDSTNQTTSATPTTHHDPLANIPVQPINPSNINVSFMPPPPSVYYNYYDTNATSPKMELDDSTVAPQAISNNNSNNTGQPNSNSMSDWFALPLDQFFNSSTAGVDQGLGGTGPMVGEFDMLEVLLKEQYTSDNNNNNNAGAGAGGSGTNGTGLSSQFL